MIKSTVLYLAYKLQHHYIFQVSLHSWLWVLVVVPPVAAFFHQLDWLPALLISLLAVLLLLGVEAGRRLGYMSFAPAALDLGRGASSAIGIEQEISCWASGHFVVGNKQRDMVNEPAVVLKLRTQERVVMVRLKRTRFLLLACSAEGEEGCWYVFFTPQQVIEIQAGMVQAGFRAHPGLVVRYRVAEKSEETGVVFLAFDDLPTLKRELDDLRLDVDNEKLVAP